MTRATTEDDLSKLEAERDAYRHLSHNLEPTMQDKFDLRQAAEVLKHYPPAEMAVYSSPEDEDQSEGLTLAENLMFWGIVVMGIVTFAALVGAAWVTWGPV